MQNKLDFAMHGPSVWPDIALPDWVGERAPPIIAKLGEDHTASRLFKKIIDTGKIEENAVDQLDDVMYHLGDPDAFMLAADISAHAFSTIKVISLAVLCA
jgi:hypothetical protein